MRIVVSILSILFGLLHLIAAFTQFKAKDPAARGSATIMACGGIAVIFEAIAHLVGNNSGWLDALPCATGCLLICFAAYLNGKRAEKVNPLHHVIRGGIAVLLVVGFVIW